MNIEVSEVSVTLDSADARAVFDYVVPAIQRRSRYVAGAVITVRAGSGSRDATVTATDGARLHVAECKVSATDESALTLVVPEKIARWAKGRPQDGVIAIVWGGTSVVASHSNGKRSPVVEQDTGQYPDITLYTARTEEPPQGAEVHGAYNAIAKAWMRTKGILVETVDGAVRQVGFQCMPGGLEWVGHWSIALDPDKFAEACRFSGERTAVAWVPLDSEAIYIRCNDDPWCRRAVLMPLPTKR